MAAIVVFILLAVVLVLAACHDWRTKQIPNVYPLCVLGIAVVSILTGMNTLLAAAVGAALGAVSMLAIHFILHTVGWGDIKLMIACCAALGSMDAVNLLVLSYVAVYGTYLVLRWRKKVNKMWAEAFSPFFAAGFGGVLIIHILGVIVSGQV